MVDVARVNGALLKVITADFIIEDGYTVIAPVLTIPIAHKIVTAPNISASTGYVRISLLNKLYFPDV